MSKTIDLSEFIDSDLKAEKYFPIEENLTEKSQEVRDAWKEIFSFANTANRAGRPYTPADVRLLTEQHCQTIHDLTLEKVEALFKKVYDQNLDEFGIDHKPDIVKVEVFLNKNYDFAKNEVTQAVEFKGKGSGEWGEINIDTVFRKIQHVGFKYGLDKLKSLVKSDFIPTYHPFRDYFEKLEPWDGVTDHITNLASFVNTSDNQFYFAMFKKFLVRCIGCSLYGRENRTVFTYIGEKQSTGKSTFIRFLSPFGDKYYTEAPIRNTTDSEFSFAENFIYNLEELSSLNNSDVNRLKAIISTATIKERKAYAVNVTQQPRRCNFIGSANKNDFLTDTENTRWLIFEVVSIDWNYKLKIDIHKVWSQAFALYHDPTFTAQLTPEEAARREATNRNYEVSDLVKELLKRTFKSCWKDEGKFYSNAELFELIQSQSARSLEPKYIGAYMSQLGFTKDSKKINGVTVRGWWAIFVDAEEREYTAGEIDVKF